MRGAFLLELGAVMLSLTVLARLTARYSFSPVPLYLGLGLILREHGILSLDVSRELIDATDLPAAIRSRTLRRNSDG